MHGQALALRKGQVFELAQQGGDGRLPLRQAGDGERPQAVFAQVQHAAGRLAHGLDHRVVPHLSAVQVARGDKKRGVQAVALQQGQGHLRIVGIAVVEGDAGGARGQAAILQPLYGLGERQRRIETFYKAQLALEQLGIDFAGKQRVGPRQHAVVDQNQQGGAHGCSAMAALASALALAWRAVGAGACRSTMMRVAIRAAIR